MSIPTITVEELAARLAAATVTSTPPYVIDIRNDRQWAHSHINHPAVHHIPMALLPEQLESIPHESEVFVICLSGVSSQRVTAFLEALGFQAFNVEGGMRAWTERIDPSLPLPI